MRMLTFFAVLGFVMSGFQLENSLTEAATLRDTADYPADPRPIVVEFFQHIRTGDAGAAWRCWNPSIGRGEDRNYEETQVRNTIVQWIATFRLEQALEKKLPQIYKQRKEDGMLTPTAEQIAKARFTTFRRLAIIRWGEDEDPGLPLELDTSARPAKWLISLSHYRETTRASVGDSFRATDFAARAIDKVTKDVLDGKVKTAEELADAQIRYLNEELKKVPKPKE